MIPVLVIASNLAVRAGLRALLSADPDIDVTGEAASLSDLPSRLGGSEVLVLASGNTDRAELVKLLGGHEAGVLLLVEDSIDAAAQVMPEALVVREALIARDLGHRAWGLLPLDCSTEELLAAVHALSEGLTVSAPALLEPLLRRPLQAETLETTLPLENLTERETEVLQRLAQGLANKQIAHILGISEHTVKFHVSSIYAKLGASNRTEAVRIGARQGLVIL